ncbi:transcriptional regulator [Enterobacter cloacae]|uniref:winged helix-turn-helix domain-containing protein n=1 Tax=Enterobacter cloacae TaxID=550 RepID=UPI0033152992
MFWIINDNIKFCPEKNLLVSMTRPELSVILTTPASRCLVLLLESAPEVVNQRDFFIKVWGEDGMLVPANTLYQNISIIRRGLRTTGETDDTLVATVPRKGFQIKKEVKVSRIENDVTESESAIAEAQPVTVSKEVIAETAAVQVKDKTPRHHYRRYLPLLFMALSFGLGYFILHLAVHDYSRKDFFKDYTISSTENGCHFFSRNDDIKSRGNFTRYKQIIMRTGLDCKKYPWAYFSSSSTAPALSVLICRKPYEQEEDAGCVTLYFRGYNQ